MRAACAVAIGALSLVGALPFGVWGQIPARTDSAPPSAQRQALFDMTGYWVSLITTDWRFRMIAPGPGEYAGIPITPAAKQFADNWNRAREEAAGRQCQAYGGAALMREPTRLHITWQDANTLRVQTDSGSQTRLLHFDAETPKAGTAPSLQGYSVAHWGLDQSGFGPPPAGAPRFGTLEVVTSQLSGGLLRKNGVPYSNQTRVVEHWELNTEPTGDQWLTITLEITDPQYLREPYLVSANFQRESSGAGWDPTACSLK